MCGSKSAQSDQGLYKVEGGKRTGIDPAHVKSVQGGQQAQTAADAVANGGGTGRDAVKGSLTPNPRGSVKPNPLGAGVSASATHTAGPYGLERSDGPPNPDARRFFEENRRKPTLGR